MTRYRALSAPTLDDFTTLAEAAFARLPGEFRKAVGTVVFRVVGQDGAGKPEAGDGLVHGRPPRLEKRALIVTHGSDALLRH